MLLVKKPGLKYYRRDGVAAWDYQTGDFPTLDANTQKDISAIVPAKAKMVHIHIYCIGGAANQVFGFKPKGHALASGYANVPCIVGGVANEANAYIPIGTDGIISYYRSTGISTAVMTVLGWFY